MDLRFLQSDDGTLIDYTVEMESYNAGTATIPIVAAEDALFIGVRYPINSFFIRVSTANDQASVMTIKYWDGSEFRSMIETKDETAVAGVTLAQSGYVNMVPDKNYRFHMEDTVSNNGNERITGLGGQQIYDRYWYKITFSADLKAETAIGFIGNKFCTDLDLASIYPDLNESETKDRFETGKTTWEEQIVKSSEVLVEDLITKRIITYENQILRREKMKNSCIFKLAEIIYTSFGSDYDDDRKLARANYKERINMSIYDTDTNANAILEPKESRKRGGMISR